MGIGELGAPSVIFKRNFRWSLEITPTGPSVGPISESFVKLAARPKLSLDEAEVHFRNAVEYIAGKGRWNELNVVYYDLVPATLGANYNDLANLYSWIASHYDFFEGSDVTRFQSERLGHLANAVLRLYDGCGQTLEEWQLLRVWVKDADFGSLDYQDSEISTISLTLRYGTAIYTSKCGPQPKASCFGCNTLGDLVALGVGLG